MPLQDLIITSYCKVCQLLHDNKLTKLRKRGPAPKLDDAEVITMQLIAESLKISEDIEIWRYFKNNYSSWFPKMGSRSAFCKQMANLYFVEKKLQALLVNEMKAHKSRIQIIDGVPIPTCHFARAKYSRCFKGEADYGYCASKKQTYFGFKGHVLISENGVICGFTLTPASISERSAVWETCTGPIPLLLGDKGYLGEDFQQELLQSRSINLQTSLRKNMEETRSKAFVALLMCKRRKVETVIGQLTERFSLNIMKARNIWRASARITRKILAHIMLTYIRAKGGPDCLDFNALFVN